MLKIFASLLKDEWVPFSENCSKKGTAELTQLVLFCEKEMVNLLSKKMAKNSKIPLNGWQLELEENLLEYE